MSLPTIEEKGGGVTAIILRKTINEVITERNGEGGITDVNLGDEGNSDGNVGVNVGVNAGNVSGMKLTDRQRVIVSIVRSNPYVSVKQMSEILSVAQRTVERDLAMMQRTGIIRHEGSDKAGIWVILENANINVIK